MNDKQILDKLESINLSLRQKQDLIDIIKDIADNNTSNDNDSNDNNKLYVYINNIEQKVLINDIEYELSEPIGSTIFAIKNETLYNYIKNYFDKNYYAYITYFYESGGAILNIKGKYPLSHIISGDIDSFEIVISFDYYALLRIMK